MIFLRDHNIPLIGSNFGNLTAFDDSTAIRSWVTSSDIFHRIPLTGEGRSLGAKISGGRGRPWGIFFGFYKTRHILLSNGAVCTVG